MDGPRVGAQSATWWVILGISGAILASEAIWLGVLTVDSDRWVGFSVGSWLVGVSSVVMIVSYFFLLVGGNKTFLSNGRGWGKFASRYFRRAPKWLIVANVILVAVGIVLVTIGAVNGGTSFDLERVGGQYLADRGGGFEVVSMAQYMSWLTAKTEIMPIGVSLIQMNFVLFCLLGDRFQRAETSQLIDPNN